MCSHHVFKLYMTSLVFSHGLLRAVVISILENRSFDIIILVYRLKVLKDDQIVGNRSQMIGLVSSLPVHSSILFV